MFVKNPLLKMMLIGMGGANLLNKAGHEALANKREGNDGNAVSYGNTTAQAVQYKSYHLSHLVTLGKHGIGKGVEW